MNVLALLSIDWEAVSHWSTLAQGLFAFLTFLATVVYVGFTYHIMKWAVGQGKAAVRAAGVTVEEERRRWERWLVDLRAFSGGLGIRVQNMRMEFSYQCEESLLLALNDVRRGVEELRERIQTYEKDCQAPFALVRPLRSVYSSIDGCLVAINSHFSSAIVQIKEQEALVVRDAVTSSLDTVKSELYGLYSKYSADLENSVRVGERARFQDI
jgi:hypothetical protein